MAKEVTLEQLAASAANKKTEVTAKESGVKSARTISTAELGKKLEAQHPEAKKETVAKDTPLVENAFNSMTETIDKKMDFIANEMMPKVMENAREIAMEKEFGELADDAPVETESEPDIDFDDEDDGVLAAPDVDLDDFTDEEPAEIFQEKPVITEDLPAPKVTPMPTKTTKVEEVDEEESAGTSIDDFDDLMKDLGIEDTEQEIVDDEEETQEELRERFKASMQSIKITSDPIDVSKFQISKTPVSAAAVLGMIGSPTKKRCDFPLIHTERNMTFEECSGPELEALRKTLDNSNALNGVIASLRFVYNHVVDANKARFEDWCKSIRTEDVEALYFGMYKACYGDSNLLARYDVPKNDNDKKACKKTSLIETPIDDMIKYKDDEAKELFDRIMIEDTTTHEKKIKSNLLVVSDDLALTYRDPSLYSTFIQYSTLPAKITERYGDLLNSMAYVDGFFKIDKAHGAFVPIAIKEYPNNLSKTVINKLKTYNDLLKTLNNDQYNVMMGKLENLASETKISFIYPKSTCPECGNEMEESPVESVLQLLFTRAQLAQIKNI